MLWDDTQKTLRRACFYNLHNDWECGRVYSSIDCVQGEGGQNTQTRELHSV